MVVSDHSPADTALKCTETGDFLKAWGGISSLQLRLPIIWSNARQRGYSLPTLVRLLCKAPAQLVNLYPRKGCLAVGSDADLVVWDEEASFCVDPQQLFHRHKISPYQGHQLHGLVHLTLLRGRVVFEAGRFALGEGRLVTRGGEPMKAVPSN
eukprot:GILI01023584.1.p3 GENE.GILI01023584.1~~GILI01023584.1.p3  ORF type:complete len:153 (-),score=52.57 GILI01023584.1:140-598(-)